MSTPLNQAQPENVTFSHSWTITDFSHKLVSSFVHPCLTSCTFSSTSSSAKSPIFRLSLFPEGINENFVDYLSIGFGAISLIENDEKITVRYRLSLIDNKGERRNTKEWLYIFSSSKRVSVFGRFIGRNELLDASNGLLLDDKLVIHCEGTVLGKPTALDYANTNLSDLKFIAKSQPNLMVEMLYNLASKHQRNYYSPKEIPNFEIQNQVDETFSYTHSAIYDKLLSHSAWSNAKYNTRSTQELMQLSRRLMLDTLYYLMNSGTHVDLSLVLGHGDLAELWNLHSIVLLNRSSAFDALLHNNTIVTDFIEQTKRVSIADAPIEVFDQLIQYLYTGRVPLLKEYQYQLFNVACEYGFDVLKQMCELAICDEITSENVIHTLIYANSVFADLLKPVCLEYITDHATELMFDLDSLKPELIEEVYRNLAIKNSFKESEDRQVYENLQLKIVSTKIEESLSYTHLKKYHIFNEFIFNDYIDDFTFVYLFESPEFCAQENSSLKFKLIKLRPVDYMKSKDFDLMVKNDRCFHSSEPQVLFIRYNLSLCFGKEHYATLGTCDGCEYVQVYSNYARMGNKLSLQNRDALDFYYPDRNYVQFSAITQNYVPVNGTFKIRSEIVVLCGISALDLTSTGTLSQLEFGQSRKHLFECMNSSLLKFGDDRKKLLRINKIVLFNRSSAFDALLHNVIEKPNSRVSIDDVPSKVFDQLMHYLCTGKVPLLKKYQNDLLNVSQEYGFDVLKQMCELTICDHITAENVIDVLILANAASADRLKRTALDYISYHATELMFDLDALKPGLIEGTISYTHRKTYHICNEFMFEDFIDDFWPNQFECPEFCAPEKSSLKFKLTQLRPIYYKNKDFDLMVKDDRCFDLFNPQVSFIRYKMSLCQCLGTESYETMGTCDGVEYLQASSNYTQVGIRLSFQNRVIPKDYIMTIPANKGTFKMRSEITVLDVISAQDLSPIRGLSQLELEQSRKHLFECMNSSLLKCDDEKLDVTLVVCGTEFKVHRVFLTQSPVLGALVAQSNKISIPDLSIEAYEPFLQYLCTGNVQSLDKYAKELLIVASRFKLEILVQMCQLVLSLLPVQWSANGTCRFKLKLG